MNLKDQGIAYAYTLKWDVTKKAAPWNHITKVCSVQVVYCRKNHIHMYISNLIYFYLFNLSPIYTSGLTDHSLHKTCHSNTAKSIRTKTVTFEDDDFDHCPFHITITNLPSYSSVSLAGVVTDPVLDDVKPSRSKVNSIFHLQSTSELEEQEAEQLVIKRPLPICIMSAPRHTYIASLNHPFTASHFDIY